MQIAILHGTITSVQETLTATSGHRLPNTVAVTGANSSYNSNTGVLTLTNLTNTVNVSASGLSSLEYDLTQLQLAGGTYELKTKAKATGYRDSNFSNSVSYVVQPTIYNNIHLSIASSYGQEAGYKVNDGEWITFYNTSGAVNVELNNVYKLEALSNGPDAEIEVGTTFMGFDLFRAEQEEPDGIDITQYLQDGCYVRIIGDE